MKVGQLLRNRFNIAEVDKGDVQFYLIKLRLIFQVSKWVREADLNQDGVLSYAEFKLSLYRVFEPIYNIDVENFSYEEVGVSANTAYFYDDHFNKFLFIGLF